MSILNIEQSMQLDRQIQVVRETRISHSAEKSVLNASHAAWRQENDRQIALVEEIGGWLQEEEEKLRAMTILVYQETQNKKPAPGVGIRITKVFNYEEARAKTWAIEHKFYNLLDLNFNKFKKAAEGLNPDFVTVEEKPIATISEEL